MIAERVIGISGEGAGAIWIALLFEEIELIILGWISPGHLLTGELQFDVGWQALDVDFVLLGI